MTKKGCSFVGEKCSNYDEEEKYIPAECKRGTVDTTSLSLSRSLSLSLPLSLSLSLSLVICVLTCNLKKTSYKANVDAKSLYKYDLEFH